MALQNVSKMKDFNVVSSVVQFDSHFDRKKKKLLNILQALCGHCLSYVKRTSCNQTKINFHCLTF